ncbi:hypothetical protein THAOC_37507, partial [Thalassiosira oceanica]
MSNANSSSAATYVPKATRVDTSAAGINLLKDRSSSFSLRGVALSDDSFSTRLVISSSGGISSEFFRFILVVGVSVVGPPLLRMSLGERRCGGGSGDGRALAEHGVFFDLSPNHARLSKSVAKYPPGRSSASMQSNSNRTTDTDWDTMAKRPHAALGGVPPAPT